MSAPVGFEEVTDWYRNFNEFIRANSQYSPLQSVISAPQASEDVRDWIRGYDKLLGRCLWDAPTRDLTFQAIGNFVSKQCEIKDYPLSDSPEVIAAAAELTRRGITKLPALAREKALEMREYFESIRVLNPQHNVVVGTHNKHKSNLIPYPARVTAECPHLLEAASEPKLMAILERYLKTPPTVILSHAWWSFAGVECAKETQLFHRDYTDFHFCDFFIYLTDVDEDAGPHCFVEGTHRWDILQKIAAERFPKDVMVFFKWFVEVHRKTDEDVERYIGRKPTKLTGPAGTMFLADTRGIHKGLHPKALDRLMCAITYASTPRMQMPVDPIPISQGDNTYPKRLREEPYRHTFRFVCRPS